MAGADRYVAVESGMVRKGEDGTAGKVWPGMVRRGGVARGMARLDTEQNKKTGGFDFNGLPVENGEPAQSQRSCSG